MRVRKRCVGSAVEMKRTAMPKGDGSGVTADRRTYNLRAGRQDKP